jgi:hypothetical protein
MSKRDVRGEVLWRMQQVPSTPELRQLAKNELVERLTNKGLELPPRTRDRFEKRPSRRATPLFRRTAHPAELLILMAISRTSGTAQFGCSPDGSAFTADTDGFALPKGRRDVVANLSPLLDDVSAVFNLHRRDGRGGRFYLRDGQFFDAEDRAVFLEVDEREGVFGVETQPGRSEPRRDAVRRANKFGRDVVKRLRGLGSRR